MKIWLNLKQYYFCQSRVSEGERPNPAVFHFALIHGYFKCLHLYCMIDGQLGKCWVHPFLQTKQNIATEVAVSSRNIPFLYPMFNICFNGLLKWKSFYLTFPQMFNCQSRICSNNISYRVLQLNLYYKWTVVSMQSQTFTLKWMPLPFLL